jgi:hypothetical protein
MADIPSTSNTYARWYFGLCVALIAVLAALNWGVDPLQFYRRATLYPPVFSENQRYQKPGLAKHYDYEIIVIGDSHAENFSARYIEERLGAPALNLAISGSTAHEQRLMAEKAIATGKVKRVLWTLGRMPFQKSPRMVVESSGDFPSHFYREGFDTHPTYLLSLDTLELSLAALRGNGHRDLDSLNMWYADHEFSQDRMLDDWVRRTRLFAAKKAERDGQLGYRSQIEMIRENVEDNLASVIRSHPEIHFDLFFPPYSILSYLIDDHMAPWMFDERLRYKASVVRAVAELPNCDVYDFQVESRITHDLDNYKDLEHYRREINELIVDSIAAQRHRVDKSRYADLLRRFENQVAAFRRQVCEATGAMYLLCPDAPVPRF